ncbi:MAG TPA: HDOD domain-containing protein [Pseudomonadales bacterium]|nr:HDOD domain-containing protein [Pseudomonadales bacterium]
MWRSDTQPNQPSLDQLKKFNLLKHLSDEQMILLASQTEVLQAKPKQKIIEIDSDDDDEYFLLDGQLHLKPRDAELKEHVIQSGTPEAQNPIARLRPRRYRVTSLTPITYFTIKSQLLQTLLKEAPSNNYVVDEVLRKKESENRQLLFDIYADLRNNKLNLPSLPDVAVRIRKLIDEGSDIRVIARAVVADPSIAAKLIRAANSVLYRGTSPCNTPSAAIIRLGLRTTRQLILSFTLRELFKVQSPTLRNIMDEVWRHSVDVAALCYVLAKHTVGLNPEEALLAGLLHDIGMIPIITYAEKYPRVASDPALLQEAAKELRGEIGGVILKKWNFPEEIIMAARKGSDFSRASSNGPDYCDLVIAAKLHSYIGTAKAKELPSFEEIPALHVLGLDRGGPASSLKILEEAKEQIAEARSLVMA